MDNKKFKNFLKISSLYKLKQIPRENRNKYYDRNSKLTYDRNETTAEHIYSSLRLADFFLSSEKEFSNLNRLKIYEMILYHDDIEIITGDTGISKEAERIKKDLEEIKSFPKLIALIPIELTEKSKNLDKELRELKTPEAFFVKAIDRMDAMIQALPYPEDWAPKGFNEKTLRKWLQPSFEYSKTFIEYFENLINYLKEKKYF